VRHDQQDAPAAAGGAGGEDPLQGGPVVGHGAGEVGAGRVGALLEVVVAEVDHGEVAAAEAPRAGEPLGDLGGEVVGRARVGARGGAAHGAAGEGGDLGEAGGAVELVVAELLGPVAEALAVELGEAVAEDQELAILTSAGVGPVA
jgi:hypothetical protein